MLNKKILLTIFLMTIHNTGSAKVIVSDKSDRESIFVSVYNMNTGLINEIRNIELPAGIIDLRYTDVPPRINPDSINIASMDKRNFFKLLEQNYEYDLINRKKLLDEFIGKEIELVSYNKDNTPERTVKAKLLSNNNGPIYEINGKIYLDYPGTPVLPKTKNELVTKPSILIKLKNARPAKYKVKTTYLTSGLDWNADYILVLDKSETSCDINGWITVDNKSGMTYEDTKLRIIAGDLNKAAYGGRGRNYSSAGMVFAEKTAVPIQLAQEKFFEYYIYDLPVKTTLKKNERKKLNLFQVSAVKIKKEFIVRFNQGYFTSRFSRDKVYQHIDVFIKFKNSKENNLGMAIPSGIIKVFKNDKDMNLQLIGEDNIKHVPVNEEVKIKVGRAFDIFAEKKQTDYQKVYSNLYETSWEIKLTNRKDEDVTISVIESLPGSWEIKTSTHKYKKLSSSKLKFDVNVPKNSSKKISYRISVKY